MILKLKFHFHYGRHPHKPELRPSHRGGWPWSGLFCSCRLQPFPLRGRRRKPPPSRADCGSRVAGCGRPGRPAEPTQRCRDRSDFPAFQSTRFWVSGQTNFIFQALPRLSRRLQRAAQSWSRLREATSRVMTLYTGVRLNDSTELLVNIEEAGGAALSTGLGLAGNTDLILCAILCSAKSRTWPGA